MRDDSTSWYAKKKELEKPKPLFFLTFTTIQLKCNTFRDHLTILLSQFEALLQEMLDVIVILGYNLKSKKKKGIILCIKVLNACALCKKKSLSDRENDSRL